MKLIVGFGNPGPRYAWTRHNFGFLALDFYVKLHDLEWKNEKMGGIWLREGDKILLKPQEFYNESGRAVANFAKFYKIPPEDILIICDDFNIPFGTTRFRSKGSAGGSNGLKSVISTLNTEEIPRFRLGSGNDPLRSTIGDVDFVLSKFTTEEREKLPDILREAAARIQDF